MCATEEIITNEEDLLFSHPSTDFETAGNCKIKYN